eukprot:contig_5857_g1321
MATKTPTEVCLALLEDARNTFDTLEQALRYVAAETKRTYSSLRSAYHRSCSGCERRHGQHKLSAEQEAVLVSVAQAFSVNNLALSIAQTRQLVEHKWGVSVSRHWVRLLVNRLRSKLSKRACKALADKRTGLDVLDGVMDFCDELKDFLAHHHFPAHTVFNYNETRVVQKGDKLVLRRLEAANKERANVRSTRHQTVASLLTFVGADGSVLLSIYILKANFDEGEE